MTLDDAVDAILDLVEGGKVRSDEAATIIKAYGWGLRGRIAEAVKAQPIGLEPPMLTDIFVDCVLKVEV